MPDPGSTRHSRQLTVRGIVDRDPDSQPAMPDLDRAERRIALESLGPESRLARDERQAGIVSSVSSVLF